MSQGEVFDDPGDEAPVPAVYQSGGNLILSRAAPRHEHNMDLTMPEGKRALMATVAKATFGWKNMPKRILNIRYWRVHENTARPDSKAASFGRYRMILVDESGETFATFSPTAIAALSMAVAVYGHEVWEPPIQVEISKGQTIDGQDYCNVEFKGPVDTRQKRK